MSARAYAGRHPGTRRRRKPAPRRSQARINWNRLGRVALVLVLFAVLASYLNPLVNFVRTWRDAEAGQERLVVLKRENAQLKQKSEALRDPAVLVREARKQGWVQPGERSYHLDGLPR